MRHCGFIGVIRVFTSLYESLRVLFVRLLERVEEREFVNAFLTALDILIYIIILYYSIYYIKNEC
jgi:membrane carboxypeptidase/penicillin-binding protein PbpC